MPHHLSEKIIQELKCLICQDLLHKPTSLLCQHIFCFECLKKLKRKECPTCKEPFIMPIQHSLAIDNVMKIIIPNIVKDREMENNKDIAVEINEVIYKSIYKNSILQIPKIEKDFESKKSIKYFETYCDLLSHLRKTSLILFIFMAMNFIMSWHTLYQFIDVNTVWNLIYTFVLHSNCLFYIISIINLKYVFHVLKYPEIDIKKQNNITNLITSFMQIFSRLIQYPRVNDTFEIDDYE